MDVIGRVKLRKDQTDRIVSAVIRLEPSPWLDLTLRAQPGSAARRIPGLDMKGAFSNPYGTPHILMAHYCIELGSV